MPKINWTKAKQDYVTDQTMSYAKIAFKYGVSETTVLEHAQADEWIKARQRVIAKVEEKLAEKIPDSIAEYQARKFLQGKQVAERAITVLLDPTTKIGGKTANEMLGTAHKLQTEALGLDQKDKPSGDTYIFTSMSDFITALEKRKQQREQITDITPADGESNPTPD